MFAGKVHCKSVTVLTSDLARYPNTENIAKPLRKLDAPFAHARITWSL